MSTRKWKLNEVLNDFRAVDRVVRIDGNGRVDDHCPFIMVGSDLIIENYDEHSSYQLVYFQKVPRVTEDSDNHAELAGVPDEIACLIPYFIKGDLFQSDEPRLSAEARSWYEQSLITMAQKKVSQQDEVETNLGFDWR